eukprot:GDKI01003752.1.p1 GENE.GDKI01003752.1~~GDKI01003752.1.p1  ORF type:complete len:530 (-),score=187.26 GDKI01003752.1:26-1615(-)
MGTIFVFWCFCSFSAAELSRSAMLSLKEPLMSDGDTRTHTVVNVPRVSSNERANEASGATLLPASPVSAQSTADQTANTQQQTAENEAENEAEFMQQLERILHEAGVVNPKQKAEAMGIRKISAFRPDIIPQKEFIGRFFGGGNENYTGTVVFKQLKMLKNEELKRKRGGVKKTQVPIGVIFTPEAQANAEKIAEERKKKEAIQQQQNEKSKRQFKIYIWILIALAITGLLADMYSKGDGDGGLIPPREPDVPLEGSGECGAGALTFFQSVEGKTDKTPWTIPVQLNCVGVRANKQTDLKYVFSVGFDLQKVGDKMSKYASDKDMYTKLAERTGVKNYTIEMRSGEYVERVLTAADKMQEGVAAAGYLRKYVFREPAIHPFLYTFEAAQRLASPASLLSNLLGDFVFNNNTPHAKGVFKNEVVKVYHFNITNDRASRYTERNLMKLFTQWQTSIGDTVPHTSLIHVDHTRTPVKGVVVKVRRVRKYVKFSIQEHDQVVSIGLFAKHVSVDDTAAQTVQRDPIVIWMADA